MAAARDHMSTELLTVEGRPCRWAKSPSVARRMVERIHGATVLPRHGPDWQRKRYSPEHRARRLQWQLEALGYAVTLDRTEPAQHLA